MRGRNINLVYILGAGHCGSTILNVMLDSHPQGFGLGEVHRINSTSGHGADYQFLMKEAVWRKIANEYQLVSGELFQELRLETPQRSFYNLIVKRHKRHASWERKNVELFSAIKNATGNNILVDSSKEWPRLLLLSYIDNVDIRVIHLVRDPRAVVNSYQKKYGSWLRGYKRLMRLEFASLFVRRCIAENSWLDVRYEDLMNNPKALLSDICEFLSIPFDDRMLDIENNDYSGVGGNRFRYKENNTIALDVSWRSQMRTYWQFVTSIASLPYLLRYRYPFLVGQ